MPNYKNGMIYKIYCKDPLMSSDIYVGSTTNFKERMGQHIYNCNNEKSPKYNFKVYKFIRENGGWDNFEMIVVEHYSCDSKLELLKQERYFIELLTASLNSYIPSRTKKEYTENNREKIKEYREINKESIKTYQKEYIENNKETLLLQKKEYREKNKESIKLYQKEYRENNKERIKLLRKEYNNKERSKLRRKEYYEKNKEKKYIIKLNE